MVSLLELEQGTDEWLLARLGKVTASRVADLMARTKSGYRSSRQNYLAEKVAERLTGRSLPSFTTAAMHRGLELEPEARRVYVFERDVAVEEVGLIPHPKIENFAASPDGLVTASNGEQGLVEFKVPLVATHIATLRSGEIDGGYYTQVQAQMSCTGRPWTDFVSYCPDLPPKLQLFVKRVPRDEEMIRTLEREVVAFLDELAALESDLKQRYGIEDR
jgi:putative phage-type endonuclease